MQRLAAFLAVVAVTAGCDKSQLFAPTNSTITLTATNRTLPLGGTTEVSAFVIESAGTAVQNGTTVHFTTTLGTITPADAQTHNGIATATFAAGNTSGVADVRATSGGIGGASSGTGNNTTTTNTVQITIGAAAVGTNGVVVTASPTSVLPSGGTVTVTATASDANGNRLAGVPVTFSTSAGTLSATTATTDANGSASVTLTTNQAATVTARVGAQSGTASITLGTATSVQLSTSPASPVAGVPMTLTITPVTGTAPTVSVNWGDGNSSSLGVVAAARTVSHTYQNAGTYAINVTATGTGGDTFATATTVNVGSRVSVTANPTSGAVNDLITFTVTPAAGTAPSDVVIDFGEGDAQSLGPIPGGTGTTVSKRYTTVGVKQVRVTQTDSAGTTTSGTVVTIR